MITDTQIKELLAIASKWNQTTRTRDLRNDCENALAGSIPGRERCLLARQRFERIRRVIEDFFKTRPVGTTIEDHELVEYHRRLREAARDAGDIESP